MKTNSSFLTNASPWRPLSSCSSNVDDALIWHQQSFLFPPAFIQILLSLYIPLTRGVYMLPRIEFDIDRIYYTPSNGPNICCALRQSSSGYWSAGGGAAARWRRESRFMPMGITFRDVSRVLSKKRCVEKGKHDHALKLFLILCFQNGNTKFIKWCKFRKISFSHFWLGRCKRVL